MNNYFVYFICLIFACFICVGCDRQDEVSDTPAEPPAFLAPSGYDIIQEATGDLDQNNELDTALAIKPLDNSSPIEIVVNNWATVETRSSSVIPSKFNTDGAVSLAIENHELIIGTQDSTGKIKSRYRFVDQKLRLIKIEKFSVNAENNYLMSFDLLNSKVEETDAPARVFNFSEVYFENANPEVIIQDTLNDLHTRVINAETITDGSDIVPPGYWVFQDAEGDLNGDGLIDKVIAIQNRQDKSEEITTIVLLKNQDSTFKKDTQSLVVIPPELDPDENPLFDSVSITVVSNELVVDISKFTGNTKSHFRYLDEQLTLTKIEQYAVGAGEHYSSSIDLLNSTLEEIRTNTMDENMPSETTTTSFHLPTIYFAKADSQQVIEQALKGHQKKTIEGVLLSGGGIDDNSVTIQTDDGVNINAYCISECGGWFVDDLEGNTGGQILEESLKGKKISAVIATEASNGRIAGPSDDEEFTFIKEIELVDE